MRLGTFLRVVVVVDARAGPHAALRIGQRLNVVRSWAHRRLATRKLGEIFFPGPPVTLVRHRLQSGPAR
jgi:hypothetical protein